MPPVFKSGSDLLEQGLDLARRRDYVHARQKFQDAAAKLTKEGSVLNVDLARVYADLMLYPTQGNQPAYLGGLASYIRSSLGATELRPGPRGIPATDLAREMELSASEISLLSEVLSGGGDRPAIATALQGLANSYRQLGPQVLFLPELFHQQVVRADSRFPVLMGVSFETLGESLQGTDPLVAAEHFQTARQYWSQAGDEARANASAQKVEALAFRAKCWFCGREGIGHGIQFVSMSIDQEVTGLKGIESSPLPSVDGTGRRLFACKGCNSAIRVLADSLAIQRSAETEERLGIRIRNLEMKVQYLSTRPR